MCGAIALVGCGHADDDGNAGTSTETTTTLSSTTASTSTDASGNPTTSQSTSTTTSPSDSSESSPGTSESGPDPGVPEVHYVGRYDASDPTHVRMGWSGVGFVVRFDGTGATARLDDASQFLTVVVDGTVQPTLPTTGGEQDYVLATGLPDGEHVIEVYRRTEGFFGTTTVVDVMLEGELLPPPPVTRRMEIVGDSITCGYGDEGMEGCSFSADTENHYMTYGAIAARDVGAELHTIAWSGKGIIFNYGDDVVEPMPELYDRTIANEEATWDYSWQPDVVAINLGTNDFSTDGDPTQQQFVDAYVAFVTHIREVNPDAFILLLSPSLSGDEATMVDGYLQDVVDQRMGAGDTAIGWANINVEWIGSGCDGHPTVATHMGMGARLVEELGNFVGW